VSDDNEGAPPLWRALSAVPGVDKRLIIVGPGTLRLYIDYDQSAPACREADEAAERIVRLLNAGWEGEAVAMMRAKLN
jgi:hypothetical protein